MITAPVSPLGQKFYVKTKYAQAIASPSTLAVDPVRVRWPENEEQPIHLMYGFLYVADKLKASWLWATRTRTRRRREWLRCSMAIPRITS